MHFLSHDECVTRAADIGTSVDDRGYPARSTPGWHHVRCEIPPAYTQLTWFCKHVERSLQPRTACLLWVTAWDIWEENLHLYYRLRQSYGDRRQLHESPGHYFLDYETSDLVSFLEVSILCGWDAHLLPVTGYAKAFVSHDEFIDFAAAPGNDSIATDFAQQLARARGGGPA